MQLYNITRVTCGGTLFWNRHQQTNEASHVNRDEAKIPQHNVKTVERSVMV